MNSVGVQSLMKPFTHEALCIGMAGTFTHDFFIFICLVYELLLKETAANQLKFVKDVLSLAVLRLLSNKKKIIIFCILLLLPLTLST